MFVPRPQIILPDLRYPTRRRPRLPRNGTPATAHPHIGLNFGLNFGTHSAVAPEQDASGPPYPRARRRPLAPASATST